MMEATTMGKLVCEVHTSGGEDVLKVLTTVPGTVAVLVKSTPGVGKPFFYWPTIPAGKVVACDFTSAPIATANTADNQALIDAITVTPQDVLTYDPPL